MHIERVAEATQQLHMALEDLVPQLGTHKVPPTWAELKQLVESGSSILLIAREDDEKGSIVGILCLTVYRVPTGLRSIIEDVIVDVNRRRRGIGEALVQQAIDVARKAGAEGISLTSNPQREAANKLYQSMGFQLRNTNPYFYSLK